MTQMLDPITVTGDALGFTGFYLGWDPSLGMSDPIREQQFEQLMMAATYYCESDQYTLDCASDLKSKLPDMGAVSQALNEYAGAERWHKVSRLEGAPVVVLDAVTAYANVETETPTDIQFGGSVLTPFAALYHYMVAGGAPREYAIQDLHLMHFAPVDVYPVQATLENQNILNGSTTFIDETYVRDTALDNPISWVTVGQITLRVQGELTIDQNGQYVFQGELRAFNDRYDAGGDMAERGEVGNMLTSILEALTNYGGTAYDIGITGALPLHFTGQRP